MTRKEPPPYFDRELSWLAFNGRVLQEADDPDVPIFERLMFLAIFSSNLDEFFRVRVAALRSLMRLKKRAKSKLGLEPKRLLDTIHEVVTDDQERFGEILRERILPELAEHSIHLIDESGVSDVQEAAVRAYFDEHVRDHLRPLILDDGNLPFLENQQIYLIVELIPPLERVHLSSSQPRYGLVEVPSPPVPRFVRLPATGDEQNFVMFLDDVIRFNLPKLFPGYDVAKAFAVKLSRDAELYLDDEYGETIVEQIRKSLKKRDKGLPCRFLYDLHTSYATIEVLKEKFDLRDEDLVPGGRYHNLRDLADFPRFGLDHLAYRKLPPLAHPVLDEAGSILGTMREKDQIVHYPYQKFDYVIRFLKEAADDPEVESVWITLYRTAAPSAVVEQLIRAAVAGKQVTVFVEVKARFDEASNLHWAERMEEAGIRTLYSFPDLKVHSKLALVGRREGEETAWYAYLGTGNFNEKTARIYADHGLFTADARLTAEVRKVFAVLAGEESKPEFSHLLVAPYALRKAFYGLIKRESQAAREGATGRILLKMNALEDRNIIDRLYAANRAGVRVDAIVRGICCLMPGLDGMSEHIHVRSIVDRFLEHARVFVFHNRGEEKYYLSSADWMNRNLSKRVEVAFPIYDPDVQRELREIVELQLRDNVKARIIDTDQTNKFVVRDGEVPVRAQIETYEMLRRKLEPGAEAAHAKVEHL